ncbi:MAG TPA: hypothetical protein VFU15_10230 [Bacteroidia bacterium]|nr:hypothetical protein [Bacteroidia bacterium]
MKKKSNFDALPDEEVLRCIAEEFGCSVDTVKRILANPDLDAKTYLELLLTDAGFKNDQIGRLLLSDPQFAEEYITKHKIDTSIYNDVTLEKIKARIESSKR